MTTSSQAAIAREQTPTAWDQANNALKGELTRGLRAALRICAIYKRRGLRDTNGQDTG